ncbi:MAG: glycosyl hydrolase [Cyanobacteria bacterium P01_C01_bin.120]
MKKSVATISLVLGVWLGPGSCVSWPSTRSDARVNGQDDTTAMPVQLLSPPTSAKPFAYWWWPGTAVEPHLLRRDLQDLSEAGFAGGYQFTSLFGVGWIWGDAEAFNRANRFATSEYFGILSDVLAEAERRDLTIDLLAGSGWPVGGTHVPLEGSTKTLVMGVQRISGGGWYRGSVPDWDRYHFFRSNSFFGEVSYHPAVPTELPLVAVGAARILDDPGSERDPLPDLVALTDNPTELFSGAPPTDRPVLLDPTSVIDLTDAVAPDGTVAWKVPAGEWYLFAYYGGPAGEKPIYDSQESTTEESLVIDHLARRPIQDHLDHALGRAEPYVGEHFGNTLRAITSESIELKADWLWTDEFFEKFEHRRGYDITPYLMTTYVPGRDNFIANIRFGDAPPLFDFEADAIGDRIRYDYMHTVSDLFIDHYLGGFAEWAHARGLQTRSQTYGIPVDTIRAAQHVDMPDVEALYAGGTLDFLRLTGSAAALHGRRIAGGEFLTWQSRDYMTSPYKIKVTVDRYFVAGINQLHYHGMHYQAPEAPYPGFNAWSQPYMPVSFAAAIARSNPMFDFVPRINEYITRNQLIAQSGPNLANVGVFHGIWRYPGSAVRQEETVNGYLGTGDVPPFLGFPPDFDQMTPDEQYIYRRMQTTDALAAAGYDYVLVNADSLINGELRDGVLHMGDIAMAALVLSHETHIPVNLAERLVELTDEGFPVFFVGHAPSRHSGFHNYRRNDAIVQQMSRDLATDDRFATAAALPEQMLRAGVEPGLQFAKTETNVHYIRRRVGASTFYFIRSGAEQPRQLTIQLPCDRGCVPHIVDLWTGVRTVAGEYRRSGTAVALPLNLEAFGSVMIELSPDAAPERYVVEGDLPVIRSGGQFEFTSTDGGTYRFTLNDGEVVTMTVAAPPPALPLTSWDLSTLSRSRDGVVTPIELSLDQLADWRDIPQLQNEAGTATYRTEFELPASYLQDRLRLVLDLGRVHEVASITVNGQRVDELLMPPYRSDITPYVAAGNNLIEVEVTPVLYNRLVGYGESGDARWTYFQGRNGLAPTGLIGPVSIQPLRRERF